MFTSGVVANRASVFCFRNVSENHLLAASKHLAKNTLQKTICTAIIVISTMYTVDSVIQAR